MPRLQLFRCRSFQPGAHRRPRVIHVDTELGAKDLLNNRMAYVTVSRGAYDAQFFTIDREKLGAALGHDVSHQKCACAGSEAGAAGGSNNCAAAGDRTEAGAGAGFGN
jgi:hypothetical protein